VQAALPRLEHRRNLELGVGGVFAGQVLAGGSGGRPAAEARRLRNELRELVLPARRRAIQRTSLAAQLRILR